IAPQIRLGSPSFAHTLKEFDQTGPSDILARARDATILINNKVQLPGEVLAQMPKLRLIAIAATGTDCVDKKYCFAHNIAISNIRGYAVNTVPEHAMALILALTRNIVAF